MEDEGMKKVVLCLALVALMVMPVMAQVNSVNLVPTVGIDVQGYVDGTAEYQAGCVKQESCEVGIKEVCDVAATANYTAFNCAANVPSAFNNPCSTNRSNCGLDLKQTKFDGSLTVTETCSLFREEVKGDFAVGSAAMNSLGGVAICSTNTQGFEAQAQVSNNHNIQNTATVGSGSCWGPSCSATASYQGSQSLNLNTSYNR